MIRKKLNEQRNHLLAGYVNETLNPFQRKVVQLWLKQNEQARIKAANLQRLQTAVRHQPQLNPPSAVLQQIRSRMQADPHSQPIVQTQAARPTLWATRLAFSRPVLVLSTIAFILTLSLLWQTLPPGIVLRWSVEGEGAQGFHVYRATIEPGRTAEASDFVLLDEVPVRGEKEAYSFTDVRLLPGQEYVYRVEVLNQQGRPAASQTVSGRAVEALPGQITMALIVLFAAYSLWVTRSWWRFHQPDFGLL